MPRDAVGDAADAARQQLATRGRLTTRRARRPFRILSRAMTVRPIVMLGDPRLRLKGETVDSFGKSLHGLLDDLTATMRDAPGVGLAAPQLGEPLRACVVEVENHLYELVNPQIVRTDGDDRDLEGCLSIPGYVAYVTRHERVWVVAQNRTGKKYKVSGSGLLGRALQHELDHLDGKLYIDYLDSMDELIPVGQGDEDEDAEVRRRDERARVTARPPRRRSRPDGLPGQRRVRRPEPARARGAPVRRARRRRHRAAEAGRPRAAARALARPRGRPIAPVLTPSRLRDPDAVAAILGLDAGARRARRLRPDRARGAPRIRRSGP